MPRQVILLRGINVGTAKRLPMAELRAAFKDAGFTDVQTYVQSGNIVASHAASPAGLAADCEQLIAERFGLSVPVIVRTREELAEVVSDNPFPEAAQNDPKHYQVTFLSGAPDQAALGQLAALATPEEQFAALGRQLYAWHPGGIHLSKLANKLTPKLLGVDRATARNWTTVTTLLEMATDAD
jgi:uncharacterized protein (DUF1697 family)